MFWKYLSDEALHLPVLEILGQHFLAETLLAANGEYSPGGVPADNVLIFRVLNWGVVYRKDLVDFLDEEHRSVHSLWSHVLHFSII